MRADTTYNMSGTIVFNRIYTELEPMYKALHAYVRRNLQVVYGAENINITGRPFIFLFNAPHFTKII